MEQDLHIDITGDSASAVTAVTQTADAMKGFEGVSDSAIASLTAALEKLDLDLNKLPTSANAAASGVSHVGQSAQAAKTQLGEADAAANAFARAASAMGAQSAEAAGRVTALTGALANLEKVAAPLLIAFAAMTAAFAGFSFLKDAAADAGRFEESIERLKGVAADSGEQWGKTSEEIEHFVDTVSVATGVTRNELMSAMSDLAGRLHDVHDAIVITRDAAIISLATGRDLATVTNEIVTAEANQYRGLIQLDPAVKAMIANHATMNQVLKAMVEHSIKVIETTDGSNMSWSRMNVTLNAAGEMIGEKLLPWLTDMAKTIDGQILQVEHFGHSFSGAFGEIRDAIGSAFNMLGSFAKLAGDVWNRDWGAAARDMAGATMSRGDELSDLGTSVLDFQAAGESLQGDPVKAAKHDWRSKVVQAVNDALSSNLDGALGNQPLGVKGSGDYAGFNGGAPIQAQERDEKQLTAAHNELAGAATLVANAQRAMTTGVNTATTSVSEQTQKMKSLNDAAYAASSQLHVLIPDVAREESAVKSSRDAVDAKYKAYQDATAALEKHRQALDGQTKVSSEDKRSIQALTDAQKKAEEAWKSADKALAQHNETLAKHLGLIGKDTTAIKAHTDAVDNMWRAYNDARSKSIETATDERATYGLGVADEIKYWQGKIAALNSSAPDYRDKLAEYQGKIDELTTKGYEQQVDASKKAYEEQTKDVTKFADQFVSTFDSMSQHSKGLFGGIAGTFKKMLDEMVADIERTQIEKLFLRAFGLSGSSAGTPGTVSIGGAAVPGMSFSGSSGSPASASASSTSSAPGTSGIATSLFSIGSGIASSSSSSSGTGGKSPNSLGALGIVAGLSFLSDLFGGHQQQQGGGQLLADLEGASTGHAISIGATNYIMDSGTMNATQGRGWNLIMEAFVKQYRGNTANLPTQLQTVFPYLDEIWGAGDAGAGMTQNSDGTYRIGNGKSEKIGILWDYIQEYGPIVAAIIAQPGLGQSNYNNGAGLPTGTAGSATTAGSSASSGGIGTMSVSTRSSALSASSAPASMTGGGGAFGGSSGSSGASSSGGVSAVSQRSSASGAASMAAMQMLQSSPDFDTYMLTEALAIQPFAQWWGAREGNTQNNASLGGYLFGLPGAFIGGLFGDHFKPADEPDKFDTQNWGQENADLQGKTASNPMNANGQQFVMDPWTAQSTNGQGWNIVMENFVHQYQGKTNLLPPQLAAAFPAMAALWGGATGAKDFKNDKNGYLSLGSGKVAKYTEFWSYIAAYGDQIASIMQNFSPVDVYQSSNGSISSPSSYTPGMTGPGGAHSFPDTGGATPAPVSGGSSGGGGINPPTSGGGFGGNGGGSGATGGTPGPVGGGGLGGGGGFGGGRGQMAIVGGTPVQPIYANITVNNNGSVIAGQAFNATVNSALGQLGRFSINDINGF